MHWVVFLHRAIISSQRYVSITLFCGRSDRLREQGLQFSFAGVDERGRLQYDDWDKLVQPNTKALVVTGASNVTGNGTNLAKAAGFAHRHGLLLIVECGPDGGFTVH